MRRVEAFLQFLRNVKMDGKRNWRTLAGASRPLLGKFPNRALFSPYSLTRIILQSSLVAQDACFFSCATMVFIHIIQRQRPQRLFYYFCTGRNQREKG